MRLVRALLGGVILFFDKLFSPTPASRPADAQQKIDAQTARLKLYQFESCPFCVKVRREIKRRNLHIELRDVKTNKAWEQELVGQGGQLQVPCLRIEGDDGKVQWMYESDDINAYLAQRFPV